MTDGQTDGVAKAIAYRAVHAMYADAQEKFAHLWADSANSAKVFLEFIRLRRDFCALQMHVHRPRRNQERICNANLTIKPSDLGCGRIFSIARRPSTICERDTRWGGYVVSLLACKLHVGGRAGRPALTVHGAEGLYQIPDI